MKLYQRQKSAESPGLVLKDVHRDSFAWNGLDSELSDVLSRELQSLRNEKDSRLYSEGLLSFAQRAEQTGYVGAAMEAYRWLSERDQGSTGEAARSRLECLSGRGSFGVRAEELTRRFAKEASDPASLMAMAAGGIVYRATRVAVMSRLAGCGGIWGRGAGLKLAGGLAGFAMEAPTFTLVGRLGRGRELGEGGLKEELLSSYLVLGGLKGMGALARQAGRGIGGPEATRWLGYAGMYGGIMLGHGLETAVGLREWESGGAMWVEGMATLLQFQVSGGLLARLGGARYAGLERQLEDRAEYISEWSGIERAANDGVYGHGPRESRSESATRVFASVVMEAQMLLAGKGLYDPWGIAANHPPFIDGVSNPNEVAANRPKAMELPLAAGGENFLVGGDIFTQAPVPTEPLPLKKGLRVLGMADETTGDGLAKSTLKGGEAGQMQASHVNSSLSREVSGAAPVIPGKGPNFTRPLENLSDVEDVVTAHQASYLFVGHGSKAQYANLEGEVFPALDKVAEDLDAKHGRGKWLAIFGGDNFNPDKPDVAAALKYLKEKHGVPLLAVQSDVVVQKWNAGVDPHVDYVHYVPTDYFYDGHGSKVRWGGVYEGNLVGATKVYLGDALISSSGNQRLAGVIAIGGGPIALQETVYARSRGIPVNYVRAEAKNKEVNGPYGSLDAEFGARL